MSNTRKWELRKVTIAANAESSVPISTGGYRFGSIFVPTAFGNETLTLAAAINEAGDVGVAQAVLKPSELPTYTPETPVTIEVQAETFVPLPEVALLTPFLLFVVGTPNVSARTLYLYLLA